MSLHRSGHFKHNRRHRESYANFDHNQEHSDHVESCRKCTRHSWHKTTVKTARNRVGRLLPKWCSETFHKRRKKETPQWKCSLVKCAIRWIVNRIVAIIVDQETEQWVQKQPVHEAGVGWRRDCGLFKSFFRLLHVTARYLQACKSEETMANFCLNNEAPAGCGAVSRP